MIYRKDSVLDQTGHDGDTQNVGNSPQSGQGSHGQANVILPRHLPFSWIDPDHGTSLIFPKTTDRRNGSAGADLNHHWPLDFLPPGPEAYLLLPSSRSHPAPVTKH